MRPKRRRTRPLAALAAVAAVLLTGCAGTPDPTADGGLPTAAPPAPDVVDGQFYRPETLRFASISGADEESSAARLAPIVDHLAHEIGMEVEFIETTDYSSVIEGMRAGRVDVAVFGPFSYVIASSEANATALVAQPNQETGALGYKSLLITRADSGITSVEQLRDRSMAFADPASTSGNLFPRLILANAGITDVESYFSETSFSGGHDASLVAVAHGQVDAAGVCDTCIARFYREGLADPADIRVIAESEPIPPSPLSARADLDPALRQQITDVYLRLVTEHPELVQAASSLDEPPTHPYQVVTDDQYDVVRELAEKLDVDLAELG
ncbi:phosphate/phosphite/phosphonate ABC transporter substrate-binding protein [Pseudonocardia sichuanensis]